MDRVILHCDLNQLLRLGGAPVRPELRELPVAVCGDPASRKGIILAKNEPAKACGVKTAETIWQARRKCPDLVLLPPHHDLYREFSHLVNAIYGQYNRPGGVLRHRRELAGHHRQHATCSAADAAAIADELRPPGPRGAGPDAVGGSQLQQGLRQAGQRLPQARRHHGDFPGKLAGDRLATSGGQHPLRRPRRPKGPGPVRYPHPGTAGGGGLGAGEGAAGEDGPPAVALRQRVG